MHRLQTAVLAVALAFGAGSAAAADLARKDARFLQDAAESGQLEIGASQIAERNGSHPDVKSFAKMMVDDHTKVDGELKTLASSKGVQLPAEPTRKVRSALSDLQKKSGPDFDKEYADDIAVDAHEDAVKLFEKAAKDAEDADVKAFAAKTLPNLQQHLAKGKELQSLIKSTHDNAKMKR
ncbi:DUF4142 domain-containing protein [Pigmentiphaga sp. GD03639]|uniref:DUF4142 domain-containing protein n=1 Tax=Pigmentiphaga daeguensis TaxID=414049 RepID=A0ABN1CV12_9BURK|nr:MULTISPECIES: DUF4142 domain-containing protein [unclassified Pigmentiphaga]MDH2234742.1 DUF4142 domain-containing protein [Pigmentiphaga sp. GD03639]OVZ64467.1 hypothetical protein CDO46_09085 [Pigmentiphaga sp. NML030171]